MIRKFPGNETHRGSESKSWDDTMASSRISAYGSLLEENLMLGKVKWFTAVGGYGFIERNDGPDVFVHCTSIIGETFRTLNEGDVVEFELVQGAHGPQATNVILRPRTEHSHS